MVSVSGLHVESVETDHPCTLVARVYISPRVLCWFLALLCCSQARGSCNTQLCLGQHILDLSLA